MTLEEKLYVVEKKLDRLESIEKKLERFESIEKKINGIWEVDVPIQIESDEFLPVYAHPTDAGADLMANQDITISSGQSVILQTGIKVAIPEGFEIQIRPRSGLSAKTFLRVPNSPGTIDTGYRDGVGVILSAVEGFKNHKKAKSTVCDLNGDKVDSDDKFAQNAIVIKKGDRIAQMVLTKVCKANFIVVDDVSTIGENRGGGFGHTGV